MKTNVGSISPPATKCERELDGFSQMTQSLLWRTLPILFAICAGCAPPDPEPPTPLAPPAQYGMQFDPSTVGAVCGRVVWDGKTPTFSPVVVPVRAPTGVEH